MSEQVMPFVGGQPDYLSLVNAEVEKVEPTIKVSPTSQEEQPPSLVPPESLPTPTERPKEVQHLKASNFTEPTLPIDWLSQSVQDYIRTVAESYGCGCHNQFRTIFVLLQNRTDVHRTLSFPSV